MNLTLGFSPCPNDTFIFDALIHHKIDTEGLTFDVYFEDVETLNQKAVKAELDITKLSYYALTYLSANYVLLDSGSALGFGVGPLLISKKADYTHPEKLNPVLPNLKVGIPGALTTANFLLGYAMPEIQFKEEMVFSEIETALLTNEIDLGVIIHENRFTYQDKGLIKVMDLGEFWELETGLPIPLGGIVMNRTLPEDVKNKFSRVLKRSVAFAMENPKSGIDFIKHHSQEMAEDVIYKHINLYVNDYTLDLGETGKKAVNLLFEKAQENRVRPEIELPIFLI